MCEKSTKRKQILDISEFEETLLELGDSELADLGAELELEQEADWESTTECEYDNVSSPGDSTCSGPTYIRHHGFGPDPSGQYAGQLPASGQSRDRCLISPGLATGHARAIDRGLASPGHHDGGDRCLPSPGLSRDSCQPSSPSLYSPDSSKATQASQPPPSATAMSSPDSAAASLDRSAVPTPVYAAHIGAEDPFARHKLLAQTSRHQLEPLGGRQIIAKKKKKKTAFADADRGDQDGASGDGGARARESTRTGKHSGSVGDTGDIKLGTPTGTRTRNRKEPLPMKMRALPQSFWQQPNVANPLPPGSVYSTLPPLPGQDGGTEHGPERATISQANTDLLFALFNSVEGEEDSKRKIHLVKRGRPKKPPAVQRTRMLQDEDPCLVSSVTESILPLIPDRSTPHAAPHLKASSSQGTQVIKIVSISHGDKSVDLPSLNVEHNYPHLLSQLVMKL